MSGTTAKVIEDSISPDGVRLTTLQLRYPRFIHAEFMTHRVFSRNASSSRAIPVAKMIQQVRDDPAMPCHWGKNQAGMQAREELEGTDREFVQATWRRAAICAAALAEDMTKRGVHKQVANRILEPFQWMHVIVTATEWANFFELRDHEDAEPNIQLLAKAMKAAMGDSTPRPLIERRSRLASGWHLPYITLRERADHGTDPILLAQVSAARCARVSYLTHDGEAPIMGKDLELYERLVGSRPLHASPIEHQATPMDFGMFQVEEFNGNLRGWVQHRKIVEMEMDELERAK
jgi:hypothetical protein